MSLSVSGDMLPLRLNTLASWQRNTIISMPMNTEKRNTNSTNLRESSTARFILPAPTFLPTIMLEALQSPMKNTKAMLSKVRNMVTAA